DYYYRYSNKKRYVTIPPLIATELLGKLSDRHCAFTVHEKEYNRLNVVEDRFPLKFSVQHNQSENIMLKLEGLKDAIYLNAYQLLVLDNNIYLLDNEQQQIIEQLAHIGLRNDILPISQNQYDVFFSEALPLLKKVSTVEIDKQITEKIIDEPLHASLYLDF